MAVNDALMSWSEPLDKVKLQKWNHFLMLPFKLILHSQLWKNFSARQCKKPLQPQRKGKKKINHLKKNPNKSPLTAETRQTQKVSVHWKGCYLFPWVSDFVQETPVLYGKQAESPAAWVSFASWGMFVFVQKGLLEKKCLLTDLFEITTPRQLI